MTESNQGPATPGTAARCAIRFDCPRCHASHTRGYFDGVDTFRCLRCGYIGHGFHPDEEIDREVGLTIREAQRVNRELGLPEGPFEP